MTFLFGRQYVLLLCLFISLVTTQTLQNPAFGEELINFSGPNGDTRSTDPSDFRVAQAQAFQTVYLANNTSYKVKPLFDFKDACNQSTTLDDLQQWNNNGLNTLSGIRSRSKIALVERGGNCTWSDKVRTVTQLSTSHQLSVNVVLIYDNQSYPSLPKYTLLPATGITTVPAYLSNQLPPQVNVSLMVDNDIGPNQSITLNQPTEIYYITNDLGLDLLSILKDCFYSSTPESKGAPSNYLFLVPVLRSFDWTKTVSNNKGPPNYLSWVIALGAFFLLAAFCLFIFFRWWRRRQRREDMEYNSMLEERNLIAMQRRKLKPLPVAIVNSYPIQGYHAEAIKNATCAICLDEFEENQPDIRILPCDHGFCVLCIDPWLTQKSTLCPICKYNCSPAELREPDDDTNPAGQQGSPMESMTNPTELGSSHNNNLSREEPNYHQCDAEESSYPSNNSNATPISQQDGTTTRTTNDDTGSTKNTNTPSSLSTMPEKEIQARHADRPSSSSSFPQNSAIDKVEHTGGTSLQLPSTHEKGLTPSSSTTATTTTPNHHEIPPTTTTSAISDADEKEG